MARVTQRLIDIAKDHKACDEGILAAENLLGEPLSELPSAFLDWLHTCLTQDEIDTICSELTGVPCHGMHLSLIGHSWSIPMSGTYGMGLVDGSGRGKRIR